MPFDMPADVSLVIITSLNSNPIDHSLFLFCLYIYKGCIDAFFNHSKSLLDHIYQENTKLATQIIIRLVNVKYFGMFTYTEMSAALRLVADFMSF